MSFEKRTTVNVYFKFKFRTMRIYSLSIAFILMSASNTEYIDEAVSVAYNAFNQDYLTTIVWCDVSVDYITSFLFKYNRTVVTINMLKNYTNIYESKLFVQTVIFAKDSEEFKNVIMQINERIIDPVQVILILEKQNSESLKTFTDIAFTNDVGDFILISSDKNGGTQLRTYIPYGDGYCDNSDPYLLNTATDLFPKKYRNLYGCPVRITALRFIPYVDFMYFNDSMQNLGGFDGRIVKLVLGVINATLDVVVSIDHGGTGSYINDTPSGSFGDLIHNIADVMLPSILMTINRYESAQTSYVYDTLDLAWCVPKRREIHQWVKVLLPFYNMYTFIIVVSFLVFSASIKLIKKYSGFIYRRSISFSLYGLFFTQVVKYRTASWLVNCLLILWVWYSFIIRIAYQGTLIEGLGHSIFEPPTTTVNAYLDFADGIGGPDAYLEFYKNTSIEKGFIDIRLDQVETYLQQISEGRRFMLVLDDMLIRLYGYDVQIIEERVANALACIHMRPRWPAATEIKRLIARSVEVGLAAKVSRESSFGWVFKNNATRSNRKYASLDMTILSSCFYGLGLMWSACSLVLILEIVFYKYTCKR